MILKVLSNRSDSTTVWKAVGSHSPCLSAVVLQSKPAEDRDLRPLRAAAGGERAPQHSRADRGQSFAFSEQEPTSGSLRFDTGPCAPSCHPPPSVPCKRDETAKQVVGSHSNFGFLKRSSPHSVQEGTARDRSATGCCDTAGSGGVEVCMAFFFVASVQLQEKGTLP